jgi:pimeloyl-ACP methyl ester carboxylesterase
MPIRRTVVLISALAGLCSGACLQSNLTTGTQSSGAVYVLYQPEASCWNGSLVMFAHGYVAPGGSLAVPQDQLTIGGISLPAVFNQLGYAFAASSFSKNGLAIVQGVNDTRDLVQNILDPLLKPKRVYLIGASEGGLVTALSAEQLPNVYNSAGAACGPIGSFQGQINYFGDFRVIFDYFFPRVILGTADANATLGGQPFDNHSRIYFGSSNDFLLNLRVERYTASPAALAAVAGNYETSGKLKIPIVTLHTTGDPIIPTGRRRSTRRKRWSPGICFSESTCRYSLTGIAPSARPTFWGPSP